MPRALPQVWWQMCQGRLARDTLWLPAWTNMPPQPWWTVTSAGPGAHSHWPIVPPPASSSLPLPSACWPPGPLSRSWGSSLPPQWASQIHGAQKSTFLFGGHSFKQEPKQRIVESHLTDKTLSDFWASLIAQLVKNQPAMQKTLVQFLGLGQEDPVEKG